MAFVKQFLTKTRPSENTCMFRYSPVLSAGQVEIYGLVSISNRVKAETSRFNKFVWDGFLDGFLSKDENIIARLKDALVASEFKLKELIRNDKVLEKEGVDLNLSVLIFKDNKVFVGILGEHKVFLFKNKLVDLTELLERNKSNVGSTIVSQGDIFVVSFSKENFKESMGNFKEVFEFEDFLNNVFEKEDSKGGAFLATLEAEEKKEVKVVEKEEEVKQVGEKEEVGVVEEKEVEVGAKGEKFKEFLSAFWMKFKHYFGKLVEALSKKLSVLFEKIRFSLRNRYGRKRWYKKLQSSSSVKSLARGIKPFKVDGYKDKELKTRRFVALFLILILVLVVFLGARSAFESRQKSLLTNELNVLMEEWEGNLDSAQRKAFDEKDESLALLAGVSEELDAHLEELKSLGRYEKLGEENLSKISDFKDRISEISDMAQRIVGVREREGNMVLFLNSKLDFGEKSNPVDLRVSKMTQIAKGENLYMVDAGEKAVFEIPLGGGDARKVLDPKGLLKDPRFVDLGNNPDEDALYVYDFVNGVLRAGRDEEGKYNNFVSLSGLTPRSVGGENVGAFAVFGPTDSLNFLVPSESRIVRALGFGGATYNLPSEYISHPSFENGTALFGDQYIYVLSKTPNGIKRFVPRTSLNSQLMVTGLDQDLQEITVGYTGSNMDRTLVVFDSEIKRFVQFTKPIEIGENLLHPGEIVLKAQYEYRGNRENVFDDVRGIVISSDDSHMYVLDGFKIWKITLED